MKSSLLTDVDADQYNENENPPNFNKAELHQRAVMAGKQPKNSYDIKIQLCRCCGNVIGKQSLSMVNEDELVTIGEGYTMFYELYRYCIIFLVLIILIYVGSFHYHQIQLCSQNCFMIDDTMVLSVQPNTNLMQSLKYLQGVIVISIFLILAYFKFCFTAKIRVIEQKTQKISCETIMVHNLPNNTSQMEIEIWLQDLLKQPIKNIFIPYDCNEYYNYTQQKERLNILKNSIQLKQNDELDKKQDKEQSLSIDIITNQLLQIEKQIHKLNRLNVAFVTLERSSTDSILKKFKREHFATIKSLFSSHTLYYNQKKIFITEAPQPREIIWQNLDFSIMKEIYFTFLIILALITTTLLLCSIQYNIGLYFKNIPIEILRDVLIGILICSFNFILYLKIKFAIMLQKLYSFTEVCEKVVFITVIVSVLNTVKISSMLAQSYQNLGLIIYTIIIFHSVVIILCKVLNPFMLLKLQYRRQLKNLPNFRNPYVQSYVHKIWENQQFPIILQIYSFTFSIVICVFYQPYFFIASPIVVIFLIVDYFLSKWNLTKVSKQPQYLQETIIQRLSNVILILPTISIFGFLTLYDKIVDGMISFSLSGFSNMQIFGAILLIFINIGYIFTQCRREKVIVDETKLLSHNSLFMEEHSYEHFHPFTKLTMRVHPSNKMLKKMKSKDKKWRRDTQQLQKNKLPKLSIYSQQTVKNIGSSRRVQRKNTEQIRYTESENIAQLNYKNQKQQGQDTYSSESSSD